MGSRLSVECASKSSRNREKSCGAFFRCMPRAEALKYITKKLNEEGVQSPQPQKGRVSRSWCPSSVRTIPHNERYRGLVVWGKTKKVRSPKTGKRVYRPRPESEWVQSEIPEQRIVSEELWQRAEARREAVNRLYSDATRRNGLMHTRAMNSAYLFSGLLKCAGCGANLTVLWGAGRNKSSQVYSCPSNQTAALCLAHVWLMLSTVHGGCVVPENSYPLANCP